MSSRAWTPPSTARSFGTRVRTRGESGGREAFPCQFVCSECGWLADAELPACPACGHEGWIDLGHINTAEALREAEQRDPMLDTGKERVVAVALATLFAGWVGAGVTLSLATLPVIGSLTALITGTMLIRRVRQPLRAALHRLGVTGELPARRRLALPPAEGGLVGRFRGQVLPETTLRSPVEERPCLAWRVRAWLRADGREELVIDDSRSAAFELEGRRVEADGVELDVAGERVKVAELEPEARERVNRFLRERGCFSHEGEWVIEELCVAVERPVELEGRGDSQAPVLRADLDTATSPYR